MDILVPKVISLISKLGAMMVHIKGQIHVIVPFIGRKTSTLTARQQCYNDVHGWYRASIEQLFAWLWHWGSVRNIWCGGPNELHPSVRILLHFTILHSQVGASPPRGPILVGTRPQRGGAGGGSTDPKIVTRNNVLCRRQRHRRFCFRGSVSAPGIFFDRCPTGGFLVGAPI